MRLMGWQLGFPSWEKGGRGIKRLLVQQALHFQRDSSTPTALFLMQAMGMKLNRTR
jgi:hypothetical protein